MQSPGCPQLQGEQGTILTFVSCCELRVWVGTKVTMQKFQLLADGKFPALHTCK